jgi:peptide/nickel transport system substrate-binding protein
MRERSRGEPIRRRRTGHADQREPARHRLDRRRLLRGAVAAGLTAPVASELAAGHVGAAPNRQLGLKGGYGNMFVAIGGDPVSFNPNLHADRHAYVPICNIFSRLVTLDAKYNVQPELAERWTIADDGLSYTFQLARTASWHDDEPVTAADVKYTLDQIRAMEDALAHRWLAPITAIEAPNEWSVVLTLSEPSASLLATLGGERTFILPAHRYRDTDWSTNPANMHPVGSGPFRFLSFTPGATVDLEAYFDYFGSGPDLDRLIFQVMPDPARAVEALRNGEIDLIVSPTPPDLLPTLRQTPGLAIGEQALPAITFLGFNLEREPVSDPAVRQALARAIDRQPIVDQAHAGLAAPATTFVPAVIGWAAAQDEAAAVPAFDPAAAASELDAVGLPVAGELRFHLVFPYVTADPEHKQMTALIQSQLLAVGVETELIGLDVDAWRERLRSGAFDITLVTANLGPDPVRLRDYVGTGGESNFWRFSDETIDALFVEGEALSVVDARADVYRELQQALAEALPLIPLISPMAVYPHTERASGFFFGDDAGEVGLYQFTEARLEQ